MKIPQYVLNFTICSDLVNLHKSLSMNMIDVNIHLKLHILKIQQYLYRCTYPFKIAYLKDSAIFFCVYERSFVISYHNW